MNKGVTSEEESKETAPNNAAGQFDNTDNENEEQKEVDKHVVLENVVGGSSMNGFPLVKADSERDMPGIEPLATRLVHQRSDHWATRSEAISWPGNSGVPLTIALL